MDRIEELKGLGLSPELAEKVMGVFGEGGDCEKIKEEYEKKLEKCRAETALLEGLYKAGAKNPRFVMGALDFGRVTVDENGNASGVDELIEGLKESDRYLFSEDVPVIKGFVPEEEGDFDLGEGFTGNEPTYSEIVDRNLF